VNEHVCFPDPSPDRTLSQGSIAHEKMNARNFGARGPTHCRNPLGSRIFRVGVDRRGGAVYRSICTRVPQLRSWAAANKYGDWIA